MKAFLISLSVLILISVSVPLLTFSALRTMDQLTECTRRIFDTPDSTRENIEQFEEILKKHRVVLYLTLERNDLNAIDHALYTLKLHANDNHSLLFHEAVVSLLTVLNDITESEAPSLQSIL